MKKTRKNNILLSITLLASLCISVSACSKVNFEPQKKAYIIKNTERYAHKSIHDLPRLSIHKEEPKLLGNILIDKKNDEHLAFQLKRERAAYKATTPIFFKGKPTISNFSFEVDKGKEIEAGIELKFDVNFDKLLD